MKSPLFLLAFSLFFILVSTGDVSAGKKKKGEAAPEEEVLLETFGVKYGLPISNKDSIIKELDRETGTPLVEVLLSEGLLRKGGIISGNPFGHLGVAVNGTVYTVSEGYWKKTKKLTSILSVEDYLYATRAHDMKDQSFCSSIGSCYGRTVWGIRVFKLPGKYNLDKIGEYFAMVNEKSLAGDENYAYKARYQNCASFVRKGLQAAGFSVNPKAKDLLDFPRDIGIDFLKEIIDLDPSECNYEIVLYNQVPIAKKIKGYATSFSVPAFRWQRMVRALPVVRRFGKKIPNFKDNTMREIFVDPKDPSFTAVLRDYKRVSWLKKLNRRIFKEKWNRGRGE
ncbi:hypothetical protein ACFL35_01745 [Candidatus Riflebacteria bacterium]